MINNGNMKTAFWDDYELITVCLPKTNKECGQHVFCISEKGETEKLHLNIFERREDAQFFYFKLYVEDEYLEFHNSYVITTDCGYKIPLKVGGIVRTERFDEQFYFDGNLGVNYSQTSTSFKLWAPTASEVILCLYMKGKKESELYIPKLEEKGVYSLTVNGDLDGASYHYMVYVNDEWIYAPDPYATGSFANGQRSVVVNHRKYDTVFEEHNLEPLMSYTDATIYELSIKDITASPEFKHGGKFLGLTENGVTRQNGQLIGLDYIKNLGVSHVQLMPIYDFGSVDELSNPETYNWGYDPEQYNVPEGIYSTNAEDYETRVLELKQLINVLHKNGIRVNMDVVYNHVYRTGDFSYSKIVPYYFFRYLPNGDYSNATGCGNDVASERRMVRKFIIDSLLFWQKEYKIDGFRFDLMGILDVTTIRLASEKLQNVDPSCMLYGEGWDMPTYTEKVTASMFNHLYMPNVGHFNDYFRDTLRGPNMNMNEIGLISGNFEKIGEISNLLLGSVGSNNKRMLFDSPTKTINYISCHDNHTIFDKIKASDPKVSDENAEAITRLGTFLVMLSQGVPFIHSGQELCRTKNGVENSYNAPLDINRFPWESLGTRQDYSSLLKRLIEIRNEEPLFRLSTKDAILKHTYVDLRGDLVYYSVFNEYAKYVSIINFSNEFHEVDISGLEQVLVSTFYEGNKIPPYTYALYKEIN